MKKLVDLTVVLGPLNPDAQNGTKTSIDCWNYMIVLFMTVGSSPVYVTSYKIFLFKVARSPVGGASLRTAKNRYKKILYVVGDWCNWLTHGTLTPAF